MKNIKKLQLSLRILLSDVIYDRLYFESSHLFNEFTNYLAHKIQKGRENRSLAFGFGS